MKKLNILITFMMMSFFGMAQSLGDTIVLTADWVLGDKAQYLKTEESYKIDFETKDTIDRKSKKYIVSFEVISQTDTNYIVNYSLDSIFLNGTPIGVKDNPITNAMFGNMTYSLETDENGMYKQLINWEASLESAKKGLKTLKYLDKDYSEDAYEIALQLIDSKEKFEQSILKKVNHLFSPLGYLYKNELIDSFGSSMQSPFFAGEVGMIVKEIGYFEDSTRSVVSYEYVSDLDPEDTKKQIGGFLKKILPKDKTKNRKEMSKAIENSTIEINHYFRNRYDYQSGWLLYSDFTNSITMDIVDQHFKKVEINKFSLTNFSSKESEEKE